MASDQHFSFKFFPQNAFVSKIFPKSSGLFWQPLVLMSLICSQGSQGWRVTPYPYEIELGIPRNPNDNARK